MPIRLDEAHHRVGPRAHQPAGSATLDKLTTLKRVQPHRLRALILEDLERSPNSSISDIQRRIGPEIPVRTVRRALETLVGSGEVEAAGEKRWRRYRLRPAIGGSAPGGR